MYEDDVDLIEEIEEQDFEGIAYGGTRGWCTAASLVSVAACPTTRCSSKC
jgi:hypothetical protein